MTQSHLTAAEQKTHLVKPGQFRLEKDRGVFTHTFSQSQSQPVKGFPDEYSSEFLGFNLCFLSNSCSLFRVCMAVDVLRLCILYMLKR